MTDRARATLPSTTITAKLEPPCRSRITALSGTTGTGAVEVPEAAGPSESDAIMPGRRSCGVFGTASSTWNKRVLASPTAAMAVTVPRNSRPGSASIAIETAVPGLSPTATASGTPKAAFTEVISAKEKAAALGPARVPISRLRWTTTAVKGAERDVSAADSFAEAYSVAIRVRPTRLRGH